MKFPMQIRRIARKILHTPGTRTLLVTYRHRGLTSLDSFIASYPRSGSTWLQFMLFECLTGSSPEFVLVNEGIPYVGNHHSAPNLLPEGGRVIKTHEPYLPIYRRVIYIVRDPRDVLLSEYKYMKMTNLYRGKFEQFFSDFIGGKIHGFGAWTDHVRSWLEARSDKPADIFIVRYRDLKFSTSDQLDLILDFLHVPVEKEKITRAVDNNSIERMKAKENEARRTYFRGFRKDYRFVNQGDIGGWKESLSTQQQEILKDIFDPLLSQLDRELMS